MKSIVIKAIRVKTESGASIICESLERAKEISKEFPAFGNVLDHTFEEFTRKVLVS